MKAISDVVAELVHAANIAGRLSDSEKLMLLTRAYVTIQEGGEALGDVEATADSDVAIDIITSTGMVAQLSDEEFKTLLLEAADQIRDIRLPSTVRGRDFRRRNLIERMPVELGAWSSARERHRHALLS